MLLKAVVTMRLIVSSFLPPATAAVLRLTIPGRAATTGRPFRTRTATTRGVSASIRVATIRTTTAAATSGGPFVQF